MSDWRRHLFEEHWFIVGSLFAGDKRQISRRAIAERPMSEVIPIFRDAAFEPELLRAMGDAYDLACKQLDETHDFVKEVVAHRIIGLVATGERDPTTLCAKALALRTW